MNSTPDDDRPKPSTRIPALGSRGQGWVALQFFFILYNLIAGILGRGATEPLVVGIGVAFGLAGAALGVSGVLALQQGKALTPLPYPREGAELVVRGAYRLVRHPIYGGLILIAYGWAVYRASIPALGAALALLMILDMKRRREEVWLREKFPDYDAYRARTRALIPFVY